MAIMKRLVTNVISPMFNREAKEALFLNDVLRQSFIKNDALVQPEPFEDGGYDPVAFSDWLKGLGYIGWRGQLRLWRVIVENNMLTKYKNGRVYFS